MSKRLQVLVDEPELQEIQEVARRQGMTVAEWVRQTLRAARRGQALGDPQRKMDRVKTAARYDFPSGEIDAMLREIESGYLESGES